VLALTGFDDGVAAAWAEVPPPLTHVEPWPTDSRPYAPHAFADVRAVGLYFHGARCRSGSTVGLARFFAVDATRGPYQQRPVRRGGAVLSVP